MASVYEQVKKVVIDQLGVDEREIIPSARFVEDLSADSLDLLELMMTLEEEFQIKISDDDMLTITTVREAEEYIEKHQQRR